ncbi:protein NDRG3 isoform X2 [Danaus plexippus]|uniref:protein NDRG3 isoform X2 n=1 Tax=Danaus plexippus TaxID=13037 RepID=UPI0013C41607|nr:protein NDRG3 isoform X2 [Danaus plexippus]XP_032527809.1 protein NDRG3 isoform X2 [Danaus plexippus]
MDNYAFVSDELVLESTLSGKQGLPTAEPMPSVICLETKRGRITEPRNVLIKMPASSEDTALLSLLAIDSMDDIELKSIQLQFPRRFSDGACQEVRVHTDRGDIMVAVRGERTKPAILTYHDMGLNYTSFQPFFNYVDMRALLENFCVLHVNAPGQEEGAPTLPDDYVYPTMDELANQINYVLVHFGIKSFIGFGVGVGANILARFALTNPDKVDALTLINCSSSQAGWIEWASHKMNCRALRSRGMTPAVVDYLMWYHFGRCPEERNADLSAMYRSYFRRHVNAGNLAMLVDSFARRTDLNITRHAGTLRPPVLNLAGALSPHLEQTVTLNSRLHPSNSTWMKISDSAMVLEEQPGKISEAFRLFLQGEGYAVLALHKLHTNSHQTRPAFATI